MGAIQGLVAGLQGQILLLVVPIAVISLALWAISIGLKPILPDWAQGMRGHFQSLALAVAVAGGGSAIMTALYGLLGGGGGGG